ncbi:MAG: CapA family protein [Oscillospiraceae bacterium]|nr:CapA family protein [Oscillospiraceae bacterium]
MSRKRPEAPRGLIVKPSDGAVTAKWNPVAGADGYKLCYYDAENPEKCLKVRYCEKCSKLMPGFKNGKEYLVSVRAFKVDEYNRELLSAESDKVRFIPISEHLKAQNVICLETGQTAQIVWEVLNKTPKATFRSENTAVAQVDSSGAVIATGSGETNIVVCAEGEEFRTRIAVDRRVKRGVNKAVMMFTGDIMCALAQQKAVERYGFDFHNTFSQIKSTLAKADFAAGVLETTCYDGAPYQCEERRLPEGPSNCNAPSSFLAAIADAGFDALVTASNHNCDTGKKGLEATVAEIKRLGVRNLGTLGNNPVLVDIRGMRVAFLCYSMISNGLDDQFFAGSGVLIGRYDREDFLQRVNAALRMGAEYIVTYMHWGTMNSAAVRKTQTEEAKFMADAGVDLIIGSHPHVIQRFEYITNSAGKRVACAYSLGNFLTSMSEITENRDSVILRVDISRDHEVKVRSRLSYIPCICENREYGFCVQPAFPPHSFAARDSFQRTKAALGKDIGHVGYRPLVFLSGSPILTSIFASGRGLRTDSSGVLVSQLSACGTPDYDIPETGNETLRIDVGKLLPSLFIETKPDYIAVDLYSAAGVSLYKRGESYFTGTKRFLRSKFYSDHKAEFERITADSISESFWKEKLSEYAAAVLAAVPGSRVILFRHRFPSRYVRGTMLHDGASRAELNERMRRMEDYFISIVKPLIVDVSASYFSTGSAPSAFEREYFIDCFNAALAMINDEGRNCVRTADNYLWLDRVIKYYDSMTKRGCQHWLLDMSCAADNIIAYSSRDFTAENSYRLLKLKNSGRSDLMAVRHFFTGDKGAEELIEAAELIYAVLEGNLTGPYDFYELAFKRKFNILTRMARLLSKEINAPVDENSAELAFLLRGKPQLKHYVTTLNSAMVDIWGSGVSRECVTRSKGIYVGRYIFRQCQALAFEPPVDVELPKAVSEYGGNRWRQKTITESLRRSGMGVIAAADSKWLVVDFYDIICKVADYKGALFETDDFITRTGFYNSISAECTEGYLFEKRNMKYCYDAVSRFAKLMGEKYGKNIILIKVEPKKTYLTHDGNIKALEDDGMFDIRKKLISLCEERFVGLTNCFVIDISRHFLASDDSPRGSAGIVNYEDEFYREAGEDIAEIVRGSTRRIYDRADENYIMLRDLRIAEARV